MKQKVRILRMGALILLLIGMTVVAVFADPARVVSKRENLPDGQNLKNRIFLDITPNDGDNRADAYVDIRNTNNSMAMQDFSDMIQVGDIMEYSPNVDMYKDGRYDVIFFTELLSLNGRNVYEIFIKDLQNEDRASLFYEAEKVYRTQKAQAAKNSGGR
jgi:hypothetical protein